MAQPANSLNMQNVLKVLYMLYMILRLLNMKSRYFEFNRLSHTHIHFFPTRLFICAYCISHEKVSATFLRIFQKCILLSISIFFERKHHSRFTQNHEDSYSSGYPRVEKGPRLFFRRQRVNASKSDRRFGAQPRAHGWSFT